jgi:hypothetical protein
MDARQKSKLERYLKNASRFLWGFGNKNKKATYRWLKDYGKKHLGPEFDFKEGTYRDATTQLLQNPGIERLLKDLIVPRVRELFSDQALDFLRVSWNAGILPDISYLDQYKINIQDAVPFLEVNKWYNYVERWGEFAGIWFEEMDDILRSTK